MKTKRLLLAGAAFIQPFRFGLAAVIGGQVSLDIDPIADQRKQSNPIKLGHRLIVAIVNLAYQGALIEDIFDLNGEQAAGFGTADPVAKADVNDTGGSLPLSVRGIVVQRRAVVQY